MSLAHVQWTYGEGRLERGPRTGPLPRANAELMAAGMRRQEHPPREVRVVPVLTATAGRQLLLPGVG